jgi:hypothetical protein
MPAVPNSPSGLARIPHPGQRFKPAGHWSFQSKTLLQYLQATLIFVMR